MSFDLDPDYKQVPERIADFKAKHPEGSLRPLNPAQPFEIVEVAGQTFVVYVAAAFRHPDDPAPGVGSAWELVPGKTPYTKLSELQNAETSAWGRAIVAVLASESKAVASAEDVRNRQADHASKDERRDELACSDCGVMIPGARSDKEPMRQHKVDVHGWIRNEDGTVMTPPERGESPVGASGGAGDGSPPGAVTASAEVFSPDALAMAARASRKASATKYDEHEAKA